MEAGTLLRSIGEFILNVDDAARRNKSADYKMDSLIAARPQ
jgi:hypothetical protein